MNEDIHDIAEDGTIEQMQELLSEGADINALNDYGSTVLHSAIRNEQTKMAIFLLRNGAEPAIQNDEGYTALHFAVIYPNIEVAKVILKEHPHVVNVESDEWGSPLLQALNYDNRSPYNMIKLLLSYGANKKDESVLYHVKAFDVKGLTELFNQD